MNGKKLFSSLIQCMNKYDTVVLNKCTLLTFACIPYLGYIIVMHQSVMHYTGYTVGYTLYIKYVDKALLFTLLRGITTSWM